MWVILNILKLLNQKYVNIVQNLHKRGI